MKNERNFPVTKMALRIGILLTLLFVIHPLSLAAEPIPAFHKAWSSGDDASSLFLPKPKFAVQIPDKSIAVFCEVDCQFIILDEDWEVKRKFGRCGDGPGDLSKADAAFVVGDSLLVTQGFRYSVFDLQGNYVRTKDFPSPVLKPLKVGEWLIGVDYFQHGKIVALNLVSNEMLTLLEPEKTDSFQPLMVNSEAAFFCGRISGNVYEIHPGQPVRKYDLGLSESEVVVSASGSGQVRSWTSVVLTVWGDGEGGAFMCVTEESQPYMDGDEAVYPNNFRHYKPGFEEFEMVQVAPTDISLFSVTRLEGGELLVIDPFESQISLLERNP
ncbi:hypothetical protein CSB20_05455 [bacterium DOLZORAL124_64_63]|nr:MAG: hypothetical protein CSB20_05455 [bacterium DOLZORAL124_64_63]